MGCVCVWKRAEHPSKMSQKEKDIAIACVLVAFDLGRDGECDNSTLVKRVDEVIATIFEMSGTSSTKLSPSRTESRSGRTISGISTKQRVCNCARLYYSRLRLHCAIVPMA